VTESSSCLYQETLRHCCACRCGVGQSIVGTPAMSHCACVGAASSASIRDHQVRLIRAPRVRRGRRRESRTPCVWSRQVGPRHCCC
jgi:hypothetical protein